MTRRKAASRVVTAAAVNARTKGATPDAQLASRPLYQGRIISLNRDTVRFPDGSVTEEFDIASLEEGFVSSAKEYGDRKGITYAAWRVAGVPASVLKEAGIGRAGR